MTAPRPATVLITTKDRRDLLRNAIRSVLMQSVAVDILVVDDGSSDGTSDMVRQEFPEVTLVRNLQANGIIKARNVAAEMVSTPVLFTLDDDAEFGGETTVQRALAALDHPRVGVVTLPLIDHVDGTSRLRGDSKRANQDDFPVSRAFLGGANALKLDLFRMLGGYGGQGRQGEESGYALRLLDHGYVVRFADTEPVDHYPVRSTRNLREIAFFHAQNTVLYAWEYVPASRLPVQLAASTINTLKLGLTRKMLGTAIHGLLSGAALVVRGKTHRSPVGVPAYRLSRSLTAEGELPFSRVQQTLPQSIRPDTSHVSSASK